MKILAIIILIVIVVTLGSAGWKAMKHSEPGSRRIVRALTWRVLLSITLFLVLMLGAHWGWWHPHAL